MEESLYYNTFVYQNTNDIPLTSENIQYPDHVEFHNDLIPEHDYFQVYVKCKLKDANDILFSPDKIFYITNDEEDNLFYKIEPSNSGLTRQELAAKILDWLIMRNAYYNLDYYKNNNQDVDDMPVNDCASNLSIYGISLSGKYRNGYPIYNIHLSS